MVDSIQINVLPLTPGEAPAGGQYDPDIDGTWFTNGTKEAFKSCKQHTDHIADTLSRNNLYEGLALSLRSTNQLTILGKEIVGLNQCSKKLIMLLHIYLTLSA